MLHFITEDGNSDLRHKFFPLGNGIKKHLLHTLKTYNGDKSTAGYQRLNNLLSMENGIAYNEMKRLKNYFDNFRGDTNSDEYILNGGEPMKLWVTNSLNTATSAIRDFKQAQKDAGIQNAFRKNHIKNRQVKKKNKPTISKPQTTNVNHNLSQNQLFKYENKQHPTIVVTESQIHSIRSLIKQK